jgi:DNA modification methylase
MVDVTLHLGDCLDVMRGMEAGSVDAVITDPPYGVGKAKWDFDVFDLLEKAANECGRLLKPEGVCFWFLATRYLPETLEATKSIPYRWQFIWYASNNMIHGDLGYAKYTACLVLSKNKAWRNMKDLIDVPVVPDPKNQHPTPKPLKVMRYLVSHGTKEANTILDPFMGSGTTGVACVELGRNFIGVEIDPAYHAIATRRIAAAQAQPSLWEAAK